MNKELCGICKDPIHLEINWYEIRHLDEKSNTLWCDDCARDKKVFYFDRFNKEWTRAN